MLRQGPHSDQNLEARIHATVTSAGGSILVTDCASTNGTFVCDAPIDGQTLVDPGEEIAVAGCFRIPRERSTTSRRVCSGAWGDWMSVVAEAERMVEVPRDRAFELFVDFPRWREWMPRCFRPLAGPDRPLREGDRLKVRIPPLSITVQILRVRPALGVAMPLKYLAHLPAATAWTGWLHGQLFLVYFVALASAARMRSWSWLRIGGASLAALVPFGTFIFERRVQASI
jgi:integral membrane protein